MIQIAIAKERCYNALSNFISAVDWDELLMVSEADRGYFADGVFFIALLGTYYDSKSSPRRVSAGCELTSPFSRGRDRLKSLVDISIIATAGCRAAA